MVIHPFEVTKNEAYRIYFDDSQVGVTHAAADWSALGFFISKDGGTFTEATNAGVNISTDSSNTTGTRGRGYLNLTADEMNADVVMIAILSGGTNSVPETYIIYTTTGSGGDGITAEEVWEYADRSLTTDSENPGISNFKQAFLNLLMTGVELDYDLVDVDLAESGFNYYGLRKNNSTYLIVKEDLIEGTLTFAYKNNNSGKGYQNVWDSRTSSLYSSSQTLI